MKHPTGYGSVLRKATYGVSESWRTEESGVKKADIVYGIDEVNVLEI